MLADPRFFFGLVEDETDFQLDFYFPGHPPIHYDSPVTHLCDSVIGICCPYTWGYNQDLIQELNVSEARPSQEVFIYTPNEESSGSVMWVEKLLIYMSNFSFSLQS